MAAAASGGDDDNEVGSGKEDADKLWDLVGKWFSELLAAFLYE